MDDCTIRMSAEIGPSDNISEVKQMKYIFLNPREWSLGQNTHAERTFISDFDGGLAECLILGDWNNHYVRISSNNHLLEADTEYRFVFWLNGGENDRNNEICQFQIVYFNNQKDCNTYKLNRNFIKPLLHYQGWELYSIPFYTPYTDADKMVDTQFFFVAGNAPMALKPALEPEFYKEWQDEPDEFADLRPQRHNLVFEDGWPSINMYGGDRYSTEVLRSRKEEETATRNMRLGALSELTERYDEMSGRFVEVQTRFDELRKNDAVTAEKREALDGLFMAMTAELSNVAGQIMAVRAEYVEGHLDGIANTMASIEGMLDAIGDSES